MRLWAWVLGLQYGLTAHALRTWLLRQGGKWRGYCVSGAPDPANASPDSVSGVPDAGKPHQ